MSSIYFDTRELGMGIRCCPAMPRKVLRTGKYAFRLAARDPGRPQSGDNIRVVRKCSRSHNRIVWFYVEVQDRSEDEIDPKGPGVSSRQPTGLPCGCHRVLVSGEPCRWWKRRQSGKLLTGSSLEIRSDP
jgi:hypothetical protein